MKLEDIIEELNKTDKVTDSDKLAALLERFIGNKHEGLLEDDITSYINPGFLTMHGSRATIKLLSWNSNDRVDLTFNLLAQKAPINLYYFVAGKLVTTMKIDLINLSNLKEFVIKLLK